MEFGSAANPLSVILSRIQFGLSVGVHFIFPIATLGITFYLLIFESLYVRTGNENYKAISTMGTKILGVVFAMGVATGIVLPFSFGTNVARLVDFAGGIFGVQLTLEVILAFMLEAAFLGVVLFARNKVSKKVYLLAMFLVFLGSHLSAFFILSVNSWLQTPFRTLATLSSGIPQASVDGFHLEQVIQGQSTIIRSADQMVAGLPVRAVMDSAWKILFPRTWGVRFLHTVFACWVAGSVVFAALGAALFLRRTNTETAKLMFGPAAVLGLIFALALPILGHTYIKRIEKWQPVVSTAMEGTFKTQNGAMLYALGWVNTTQRKTYGIGIPGGLSFLDSGRFRSREVGLDELLEQGQAELKSSGRDAYLAYEPHVQSLFQTFHFMVFLGLALLALFVWAVVMRVKNRWEQKRWVWTLFFVGVPLPFLAAELGWLTVELGRQPWLIYGLFKTMDGISVVPPSYVTFSLSLYGLVYIAVFVILAKWIPKIVRTSLP